MSDAERALLILRNVRAKMVESAVDTVLRNKDHLEEYGITLLLDENDLSDASEKIGDLTRLIYAIEEAYGLEFTEDKEEELPAENPWTCTVIA